MQRQGLEQQVVGAERVSAGGMVNRQGASSSAKGPRHDKKLERAGSVSCQREDLGKFEKHFRERLEKLKHESRKYKALLSLLVLWVCWALYGWWNNEENTKLSYYRSISGDYNLWASGLMLVSFFTSGLYEEKILAPKRTVQRFRRVLKVFNLTCDRSGKLILARSLLRRPPGVPSGNSPGNSASRQTGVGHVGGQYHDGTVSAETIARAAQERQQKQPAGRVTSHRTSGQPQGIYRNGVTM
eukprot:Nk52_evm34s208 gene=Nk52_evmTU34s208